MPKNKKTTNKKSKILPSNFNLNFLLNKDRRYLKLEITKKNKKAFVVAVSLMALGAFVYMNKGVLIAASVNGVPISRYSLIKEVEGLYGKQVLEDLITKEIIKQEVRKSGIEVEQKEVDDVIASLEQSLSQQGTSLEVALAMQGQNMETLRENVMIQKSLEKLMADKVNVSDEDVLGYYTENSDFYEGQDFDDIKDMIKDQMVQEKLSSEVAQWLTDKKSSSKIDYFIKY